MFCGATRCPSFLCKAPGGRQSMRKSGVRWNSSSAETLLCSHQAGVFCNRCWSLESHYWVWFCKSQQFQILVFQTDNNSNCVQTNSKYKKHQGWKRPPRSSSAAFKQVWLCPLNHRKSAMLTCFWPLPGMVTPLLPWTDCSNLTTHSVKKFLTFNLSLPLQGSAHVAKTKIRRDWRKQMKIALRKTDWKPRHHRVNGIIPFHCTLTTAFSIHIFFYHSWSKMAQSQSLLAVRLDLI